MKWASRWLRKPSQAGETLARRAGGAPDCAGQSARDGVQRASITSVSVITAFAHPPSDALTRCGAGFSSAHFAVQVIEDTIPRAQGQGSPSKA